VFVTAQARLTCASAEHWTEGTPQRALSAASELQFVGLGEALEFTLLLSDEEPDKSGRAAGNPSIQPRVKTRGELLSTRLADSPAGQAPDPKGGS
jgi:hypothetical protein